MAGIQINGVSELIQKLERLERLSFLYPAIAAATLHVKGKIAKYPPSSEANTPNQRRWYQRGYGSKWMRRDGSVGGSKTSETLGRKWTTETANGGLTGVVGNNVSYGPYVQDAEKQAAFHAARGWKTTDQVADEEQKRVGQFILQAIEKALEE